MPLNINKCLPINPLWCNWVDFWISFTPFCVCNPNSFPCHAMSFQRSLIDCVPAVFSPWWGVFTDFNVESLHQNPMDIGWQKALAALDLFHSCCSSLVKEHLLVKGCTFEYISLEDHSFFRLLELLKQILNRPQKATRITHPNQSWKIIFRNYKEGISRDTQLNTDSVASIRDGKIFHTCAWLLRGWGENLQTLPSHTSTASSQSSLPPQPLSPPWITKVCA